ncbi:heterokaryon incompatibility protein-domain-containing protein [Rhexocercosporidium sp. MPI-PUGE-AT-0058]|nr:heterokaryon incompatibility protein-domain-containing protein [Rhexocercosporidium sp. MPI-PUGE-AT-0058]
MACIARGCFLKSPIGYHLRSFQSQLHHTPSRRLLSYRYTPLSCPGQIRLLKLLKGVPGSDIKCEFLPVDLASSSESYNAISYTWGNPVLKHSIVCGRDELRVAENVRCVLDKMRMPDEAKFIWIDALCIDQQNLEERGQQVKLMGQIYSSAESVDIWLGPEADGSALLEAFIPKLANILQKSPKSQFMTDEGLFRTTETARHSPEWTALKRLFERPWFNRTWIVQEIVASSHHIFVCGNHRIPAVLLVRVARELRDLYLNGNAFVRYHGFDHAIISKFLRMARIWRERQYGKETYFSLLAYSFWSSEASDPKDKIFSMVGLDASMATRLEPDYRATVQTVYINATREALLSCNSIGIISLAGIGNPRVLAELPSWVPDFSVSAAPQPPFELFLYNGSIRGRWVDHPVHVFEETLSPFLFHGSELTLDSIKFDSIKSLSTVLDIADETNLNAWAREAESLFLASKFAIADPDWDAHWRSLIADRVFEHAWYKRAPQLYERYYSALRKQLEMLPTHSHEFAEEEIGNQAGDDLNMRARRFVSALWQSAHGRRYCLTARGDMAIVPRFAEVGDEICLLAGCNAPFVIRRVKGTAEDNGLYELVGECYVHEIMRGDDVELRGRERLTFI